MSYFEHDLTERIIGAAIEVHKELGPGLLESIYETCLCHEFGLRQLRFQRQIPVPIYYKELCVEGSYRMDLVVEDRVVVELKSLDRLLPVHEAQLLTYLRITRKRVGLLFNFNEAVLKDGIRRLVL